MLILFLYKINGEIIVVPVRFSNLAFIFYSQQEFRYKICRCPMAVGKTHFGKKSSGTIKLNQHD